MLMSMAWEVIYCCYDGDVYLSSGRSNNGKIKKSFHIGAPGEREISFDSLRGRLVDFLLLNTDKTFMAAEIRDQIESNGKKTNSSYIQIVKYLGGLSLDFSSSEFFRLLINNVPGNLRSYALKKQIPEDGYEERMREREKGFFIRSIEEVME